MSHIVVFDLDDTLFPEEDYVLSGFRAVDAWLAKELQITGFRAQAEVFFRSGARGNIFDLALSHIGVEADKTLIDTLVQVYREHQPELRLFPDAEWAVHHFAKQGLIALISDGYLIAQQNKFAALGIAPLFHTVVFSDALARAFWKPSPAPYEQVMAAIPRPAKDFVYVADNPRKDFLAPNRLGWKTMQILRPNGVYFGVEVEPEYRAQRQISSLLELKSL
jgi:putative hydrolase of the HAD superfamily